MATGRITTRTAEGGTITPTDSDTGGAPIFPFLTADIRYGSPVIGDSVTYLRGHDSSGRLVAKAIQPSE
jgi:hypothetical protein